MIHWDGVLPVRRYAVFADIIQGECMVVVTGDDILRAEKWGGFIRWWGPVRPAESRNLKPKVRPSR